ncbi:MAG: hypothetical protein ABIH26_07370 [Candidatus Eisenbacteria bacterium]
MIRSTSLLLAALAVLSAAAVAADPAATGAAPGSVFDMPPQGVVGILDPSKLSMSNRFSLLYSSGSGGVPARGIGLYENRLSYQLADPLRVTFLLGYEMSPFTRGLSEDEKGEFLPGLSLSYRPNPNFLLQFQYRRISSSAYYLHHPRFTGDPFYEE